METKKLVMIGGALGFVATSAVLLARPTRSPVVSSGCSVIIAGVQSRCSDNLKSPEGNRYRWTIEKAGPYSVEVTPPEHLRYPLDAQVVVKDPTGEVIADKVGAVPGSTVTAMLADLKPATYLVTVKDVDGALPKEGFNYALEVRAELGGPAQRVADEGAPQRGSAAGSKAPSPTGE